MCLRLSFFFEETENYIFYREHALFLIFVSFFKCNLYLHSDHNSSFSRKSVDLHLLPPPPPTLHWLTLVYRVVLDAGSWRSYRSDVDGARTINHT